MKTLRLESHTKTLPPCQISNCARNATCCCDPTVPKAQVPSRSEKTSEPILRPPPRSGWPPSIISWLPRNWLHRRWAPPSLTLVLGDTSSTGDEVGRLACLTGNWNRPVPDGEVVA